MRPFENTYTPSAILGPMHPMTVVSLILILLVVLIFGLHWGHKRFTIPPETSRKLLHVIMGLVATSFPWVFSELWPVVVVSTMALALLAGLRWIPVLRRVSEGTLLGVRRDSFGELLFPATIGLAFWLTGGNRLVYPAAVLCLTLSDSAASLVGQRIGRHVFRISSATKSLEGSGTFFVLSLSIIVAILMSGGFALSDALVVAIPTALAVTTVEAVSSHGFDNLAIPLVTALVLALCASAFGLEPQLLG